MRYSILVAISSMLMALGLTAQTEQDAIRFSTYEFGGTARYNAMAGAFGALGGDISVINTNPAGLGLFRSSDLMITPTFSVNGTKTEYRGDSNDDSRFNFNFNNLGTVGTYDLDKGKWKKAQFAFSYTRLQDFQNNYTMSGENDESSFLEPIALGANGISSDELEFGNQGFVEWPAWQTYLLDTLSTSPEPLYTSILPAGTNVDQLTNLQTRGRISETSFAGSANYDDRLYIGVALGFQRVVYDSDLAYTEKVLDEVDEVPDIGGALKEYTYIENVEVRGNGMNVKLGAIFKATDNVRVGAAYHSPTWSTLINEVNTSMTSLFDNGEEIEQQSAQIGLTTYNLTSPHRLIGSLGIVLGKKAILSADYERIDYGAARLRTSSVNPGLDFRDANTQAKVLYTSAGNLRVGAEYRIQPFSLRLGTALYDSPFKKGVTDNDRARMIYTGGIGYKAERTYVDVSYKLRTYSNDYFIYDPTLVDAITLDHTDHSISITCGVRF